MSESVSNTTKVKLSRKEWRKLVKKKQRQKRRQKVAKARDFKLAEQQAARESSPSYQRWLKEQEDLERFAEEEEQREAERQNRLWLERETTAQELWAKNKEIREKVQKQKEEQIRLIQEEWLARQQEEQKRKEEKEKGAREELLRQENWMKLLNDYLNSDDDLAPFFLPEQPPVPTDPAREPCPFFSKTANCRFGDLCSRSHEHPAVSKTLLIPNFYQHFGLNQVYRDEFNSDSHLEYEDSDIYNHFREFYEDVLPELEETGRVVELRVCCNFQAHLRGHVFVEYARLKDAVRSFLRFHGRWYDGRQLSCRFVNIPSWRAAICGLFSRGKCPKGRLCNYLHVFRNPGRKLTQPTRKREAEWRWSESPPPVHCEPSESSTKSRSSKSSSSRERTGSGRRERPGKSSRSLSRSTSRDRSRPVSSRK